MQQDGDPPGIEVFQTHPPDGNGRWERWAFNLTSGLGCGGGYATREAALTAGTTVLARQAAEKEEQRLAAQNEPRRRRPLPSKEVRDAVRPLAYAVQDLFSRINLLDHLRAMGAPAIPADTIRGALREWDALNRELLEFGFTPILRPGFDIDGMPLKKSDPPPREVA